MQKRVIQLLKKSFNRKEKKEKRVISSAIKKIA